MLNPYIQSPETEKVRPTVTGEESLSRMYARSLDTAPSRGSMGLWVGRLLIRMGEKLTKEDMQLKSSREHA